MKLQYYEEIIKSSPIQSAGEQGESAEDDTENENGAQSANEDRNNNGGGTLCHKPLPSITSHEFKVLQVVIAWMVILSVTSFMPISNGDRKFVIGVAVNLNLIFFYAAPLSTILTVIRTKSSSSIHILTMIMNTVNSLFWCIYSFAIQDYYILIPNGLGFLFGLVQIVLYLCYQQSDSVDADYTEQFLDVDGNSNGNEGGSGTDIA